MKRALGLALLLLTTAAPAWAQSDNRWVALFYMSGANGQGADRTTGYVVKPAISETNNVLLRILDMTGTPYRICQLPDSAGGWASVMGATRPAGMADSTWFRQNGCMGWASVVDHISTGGNNAEIARFFTTGKVGERGVQTGSPVDGKWSTPGVMFCVGGGSGAKTSVAASIGINDVRGLDGTARAKHAFADNGDSISYQLDIAGVISPAEAANVTPIIRTDTLDATGVTVAAWRYKDSAEFYYVSAAPYHFPTPILLGMASLFRRAGYTPRRLLNLHATQDHIFPDQSQRTAPIDSFYKYTRALNFRMSGAIEAQSGEIADDAPLAAAIVKANKAYLPAHPHSHAVPGMNFVQTNWNISTFADSATKRQRWNFLEKAVSDTIRMTAALGYERTASFPNNCVFYPDLYILAQNNYTDIRSWSSDSIGVPMGTSGMGQRVWSNRVFTVGLQWNYALPFPVIEPKSGRTIYVHDCIESPNFADTVWAQVQTEDADDINGKCDKNLSAISRMILWDGDWYFHPDANLSGASNGNMIMNVIMRRFTYFYGRVRNLVTLEPHYLNKELRPMSSTGS